MPGTGLSNRPATQHRILPRVAGVGVGAPFCMTFRSYRR